MVAINLIKAKTAMKTIKILCAAVLGMLTAVSCVKPDENFIHRDSRIITIEIQPDQGGTPIQGIIDTVTNEIFFPIPKIAREAYDITKLMVRAELPFDAYIYPSLTGDKDLSDPDNRFEITVMAGDGSYRKYTLWAFYERRTE
jgi:hypothetical protein